jgi:hypothetical protein
MRGLIAGLALLLAGLFLVAPPPPNASSYATTTLAEMVGTNVVVNDTPSDIGRVAGWARDYHKSYWYEPSPDSYRWESGWQYVGNFYRALRAVGVKVMPATELAPAWASSNGQITGNPDPAAHANYLGDLVAHFGDTIAAVENFNEPNQSWRQPLFPSEKFGTMTAHDYEAVKAADPNLLFVLAGMAGPDTTYLDAANRASDGKFDVVNFHWYAPGDTTNGGVNPEAGGLADQVGRVRSWRDAHAPGKPVWITEFGWDTFQQTDGRKSKVYAPESSAANYLLRALFLMQAQGVEKGFVFMYRDPTSNALNLHVTYNSAGLVTNTAEADGRKKPGWYYLATLKSVLGDYALDHVVLDGPNIYHYEYAVPGTAKRAAVLWARNGDRDNGYTARYQGPAGTLVVPTDGAITGTLSATNGDLTLEERPVFVLYPD